MRPSTPPSTPPGANRMVLFLLAAGVVILAAAAIILYQRRAVPPAPRPAPPDRFIEPPAPLVIAETARPLQPERDAAPEESAPSGPRARKREVFGTIDAKAVSRFMNQRFDEVRNCYERRLKANSFLEGKLDLNIEIATTGKVTAITVNSDTVRDGEMLTCVRRTISAWEFPRPENGRVVIAKSFSFKKKP